MVLNSKILYILSIIMLLSPKTISTYDNSHFYRAHFFNSEPRLDKNYLSSFDVIFGAGSTCKGINSQGGKTCLLDICGYYNMQYLGKNVQKDLTRESDLIMQQFEQVESNNNLGLLSFSGEFKTTEADLSFYQNFKNGFFLNLHIPIRKLEITQIKYKDVSCSNYETCNSDCTSCDCTSCDCNNNCSCSTCTDSSNPYWQAFLNSFNTILSDHDLNISPISQSGLGDISAVLGYTINYEDSKDFDFLDSTFKFGIITPTSKIKNENYVFSLPLGYNGHTGVFGSVDVAFGVYDWATLGLHLDAISFNKICKNLRIKTACEQSGLIKLQKDTAREKMGNIYNASAYFKADHVIRGLSIIAAYSYSAKQKDELDCFKNNCSDCEIANTDCSLQKWDMHTINLIAEYDLANDIKKYNPRINAFYNIIVGGKRIFKTNIGGAGIGLDITWD